MLYQPRPPVCFCKQIEKHEARTGKINVFQSWFMSRCFIFCVVLDVGRIHGEGKVGVAGGCQAVDV